MQRLVDEVGSGRCNRSGYCLTRSETGSHTWMMATDSGDGCTFTPAAASFASASVFCVAHAHIFSGLRHIARKGGVEASS